MNWITCQGLLNDLGLNSKQPLRRLHEFFSQVKTGNTHNLHARPELPTHEEKPTVATETNVNVRENENSTGFSPVPWYMIEEKIKANFELFPAQFSALVQMLERLIQGKSAREFTTASSRKTWFSSELLLREVLGASGAPTIALMTAARQSFDLKFIRIIDTNSNQKTGREAKLPLLV